VNRLGKSAFSTGWFGKQIGLCGLFVWCDVFGFDRQLALGPEIFMGREWRSAKKMPRHLIDEAFGP